MLNLYKNKKIQYLNRGNLNDTFGLLFLYYLLATGVLTRHDFITNNFLPYTSILLVVLLYLYVIYEKYINTHDILKIGVYIAPVSTLYIISGYIRSSNIELYIKRVEGAFLITFLVAILGVALVRKRGMLWVLKGILVTLLTVLFATLIFKLNHGFFDRDVRFLINGPIVFSWFMGLGIMLCVYLAMDSKVGFAVYSSLVVLFSASVAWTESKGPVLMSVFIFIKLLIDQFIIYFRFSDKDYIKKRLFNRCGGIELREGAAGQNNSIYKVKKISICFGLMSLSMLSVSLIMESSIYDRFLSALPHSFNSPEIYDSVVTSKNYGPDVAPTNYGSIGVRIDMWLTAFGYFMQNPFFGIGPTNFSLDENFGYQLYPHNVILEIASELGLIGLIVFIVSFFYLYLNTTYLGRVIVLYFSLGLLVSGDVSYLRLILGLPLILMLCKGVGAKCKC